MCVCCYYVACIYMLPFTVEQRLEPIPLNKFSEHVANMHKDRDLGFEEEYSVCYDITLHLMCTIFDF